MSLCLECHPCWPAHSKIIPPSLLCFLLRGRGLINSGCAETRPFPKRAPPHEWSLRASSFYFGAGLIGLLVLPTTEVDGDVPATCGGCMVLSLWSLRRWRDAMFEGPSGRSRGRTKFAEPSNDRAVRFIQRWSKKAAIYFLCPFLVCRLPRAQGLTRLIHPILACAFGEQRKSTSPYAPHPCFGGRKRCQSGL